MNKIFTVSAFLAFIMAPSQPVFAEGTVSEKNWYGRLGVGFAKQINDYDEVNYGRTEWDFVDGPNFTVSAGYDGKLWALEGEVVYRTMDMDVRVSKGSGTRLKYKGDQSHLALMLNSYFHPRSDWIISPYLGLGIGITKISWNNIIRCTGSRFYIDDSDNVFTYQLIVGGSYKITPQLFLEADYRYYVPDDAEITESRGSVGKFTNQELNVFGLAIKYKF